MINHNAKTTFLALALLAQPIYAARDDGMQPLKTVGIIGGLCLGAYAIGNGISYLFTPSDEQLLEKAQYAQDHAQRLYGECAQYLQDRNYEHTESSLRPLVQRLAGSSIKEYKYGMRESLQAIRKAGNNLRDRLSQLERKNERSKYEYRAMQDALQALNSTESSLQRAYDYIDRHTGYFVLYATVSEIQGVYSEILSYAGRDGCSCPTFTRCLRECIASYGVVNHATYPAIAYAQALTDSIRALESAINQCNYSCDLLAAARQMLSSLSRVRTAIVADDRYAYEVQDRERARREEERLRIERERVAAEQRRADAAERQNREMARQNEILREQNRLERERNERHRYCDHYRCCCDQKTECPVLRIEVIH